MMRRPSLRGARPLLAFAAMLLPAMALTAPLRLMADAVPGLSARQAGGSLWAGRLEDARLGPVALGDMDAGLVPGALLLGRLSVHLDTGRARASVTLSPHGLRVDDLSGTLPLDGGSGALPFSTLQVNDGALRFDRGRCREARGRIMATTDGPLSGIALPAGLSGALRCDGAAVLLPLADAGGAVRLDIRLGAGGRVELAFTVHPADDAERRALIAAGFTPAADGYRLDAAGTV